MKLIMLWLGCCWLWSSPGLCQEEDDLASAVMSLTGATANSDAIFDGLSFSATTTIVRPTLDSETEEKSFSYSQADTEHWRLDLKDSLRVSIVRDGDFWFTAADKSYTARTEFDRLGFDSAASDSIEGSLHSQNPLLSAPSHLLDIPLTRFVSLPGVKWTGKEEPTRKESLHRMSWMYDSHAGSALLPSHGAIEWLVHQGVARITHYEYFFGKPGKANPKGAIVDVWYEDSHGRLVPQRVLSVESGVRIETIRNDVAAAETDLAFYSPEAFGLARPRKPWETWQIWGLLGIVISIAALGMRYLRTRPHVRSNTQ